MRYRISLDRFRTYLRVISKLLPRVSIRHSLAWRDFADIVPVCRLREVKYNNISAAQAALYDRDHPRYPYKSHGQWLKAVYGMTTCLLLIVFNKVEAFLAHPFDIMGFIYSYIGVRFSTIYLAHYSLIFFKKYLHIKEC